MGSCLVTVLSSQCGISGVAYVLTGTAIGFVAAGSGTVVIGFSVTRGPSCLVVVGSSFAVADLVLVVV